MTNGRIAEKGPSLIEGQATWFCATCWAALPSGTAPCPRCGAERALDREDYEQLLIRALKHPLHDRRLIAATVLGDRRSTIAVASLIEAMTQRADPYLGAEAARALAKIGDPAGLAAVRTAAREASAIVREAARRALASNNNA
jgi:HEAT repeat protein